MQDPLQQMRQSIRSLGKSPVFSLTAILILTIGISANIVVFGILDSVMFRALPFRDPERIVTLNFASEQRGFKKGFFSWQRFQFLQQNHSPLQTFAAWTEDILTLTGSGEPQQLSGARVSTDLLKVLGLKPVAGRDFLPGEDEKGANPAVLISYALWQRRFDAAQNIIGRSIDLDGTPFLVIGILPPGLKYPEPGLDFWIPQLYSLSFFKPSEIELGAAYLTGVGRLKDGVSTRQAEASLQVGQLQYVQQYPGLLDAYPNAVTEVVPLRDKLLGNVRRPLLTLASAVCLVLLIACGNVAGLLLARGTARTKEMAIRASLGATRANLMRQIFVEGLILAVAGGISGCGVAWLLMKSLAGSAQRYLPVGQNIKLDGRLLLFALGLAVVTSIIFSITPSLQIEHSDLNSMLCIEGRSMSAGRKGTRTRRLLVVAQVALSMVLLVCATLLVRSFILLQSADPGFDPRQILSMKLNFSPTRYGDPPKCRTYARELLRKIGQTPGVSSVSISFAPPLTSSVLIPVQIVGRPVLSVNERPLVQFQTISPNYFEVLKIPLKSGRTFTEFDDENVAPLAIVNEKMARRFWPNESAVGKRILIPQTDIPFEVVGVVGDVKNISMNEDAQEGFYVPYSQFPLPRAVLMMHTIGRPEQLISQVKSAIQAVDPDQAVTEVVTLEELVSGNIGRSRLILALLTSFSAAAMFLAMVGLYGVLAYSVGQRQQELAIRMAVGSSPNRILGMVMVQGLRLVLVGSVLGAVASFIVVPLLTPLLYRVAPSDPVMFVVSTVMLMLSGICASFFPAYRAARINPATALK
jgi:putative ABC transport system permease protein